MDCKSCGACCAMGRFLVDVSVLEPIPEQLRDRDDPEKMAVLFSGRCIALRGQVADFAARCSIYEMRPHACRKFPAGSPACERARRRHGLPVP